jgi:hypothetical protein
VGITVIPGRALDAAVNSSSRTAAAAGGSQGRLTGCEIRLMSVPQAFTALQHGRMFMTCKLNEKSCCILPAAEDAANQDVTLLLLLLLLGVCSQGDDGVWVPVRLPSMLLSAAGVHVDQATPRATPGPAIHPCVSLA